MVGLGPGSLLLLPLPLLTLPRGGVVLLADAARVAFADASLPPAPWPAADAPFLPDVASAPADVNLSVLNYAASVTCSRNAAVRIQTGGDNNYQKQVLLAVILALVAVTVMVILAVFAWTFWRKAQEALNSKKIKIPNAVKENMLATQRKLNSLITSNKEVIAMMDFSVLESATSKFSEKNILGKGGFGCVYRACLDKSVGNGNGKVRLR